MQLKIFMFLKQNHIFFQLNFTASVDVTGNTGQADGVTHLACPGTYYLLQLPCTTAPRGWLVKAHSANSTSPVCSLQRRRSHKASPGGCTYARLKTTAVPVHWSSARKETQLTTVFLDSWSLAGASAIDRCHHVRLPSLNRPTEPRQ